MESYPNKFERGGNDEEQTARSSLDFEIKQVDSERRPGVRNPGTHIPRDAQSLYRDLRDLGSVQREESPRTAGPAIHCGEYWFSRSDSHATRVSKPFPDD